MKLGYIRLGDEDNLYQTWLICFIQHMAISVDLEGNQRLFHEISAWKLHVQFLTGSEEALLTTALDSL